MFIKNCCILNVIENEIILKYELGCLGFMENSIRFVGGEWEVYILFVLVSILYEIYVYKYCCVKCFIIFY